MFVCGLCNKKKPMVLTLAVVLAAMYCGVAGAQSPSVLTHMPGDALGALVIPSLESLATQFNALVHLAGADALGANVPKNADEAAGRIALLLQLNGVKDMAGLVAALGVDASKPVAVIVPRIVEDAGFILPVADREKAETILNEKIGANAREVALGVGDTKAKMQEFGNLGYFMRDGQCYIGLAESTLKSLASTATAPRTVRYGAPEFPAQNPKEIAFYLNMAALEGGAPPALSSIAPIFPGLAAAYDEAVLALAVENNAVQLRLAGHGASGTSYADAAALKLPQLLSETGAGMLALRLSGDLKEFIGAQIDAFMGGPERSRQVKGIYNMLATNLGEELVVSVLGAGDSGVKFVACAEVPTPDTLLMFMRMAGLGQEPKFTHNEVPVFVAEGLIPNATIHVAHTNGVLAISTDQAAVKKTIESAAPDAPKSGGAAPQAILDRGKHGFLILNGAEGAKLASDLGAPIAADAVKGGQVTLT
ncbi:MAG TPA: hypothetical protein ENN65_01675, partial [Candidatus Hydrogenedentes bacterium]|nr:hypothetical protein [Candidatus Hydrogenedentota bacterium]